MTASVETFKEGVRAVLTSAEPEPIVAARLIRELAGARRTETEAEALMGRIKGHEQRPQKRGPTAERQRRNSPRCAFWLGLWTMLAWRRR